MDDNRFPFQNDAQKRPPASGFDDYHTTRDNRVGKFKVNIDGLDNEPPAYVPTNPGRTTPRQPQRPQTARPTSAAAGQDNTARKPQTGRPVNDSARRANAAARPTNAPRKPATAARQPQQPQKKRRPA